MFPSSVQRLIDNLWGALLPAVSLPGIDLIEGETITPMLLARRFTLNPVLIDLIAHFLILDVGGARREVLAVPMLAITKIICDRIQILAALGHFLEG